MNRLTSHAAMLTVLFVQGCATSPYPLRAGAAGVAPAVVPVSGSVPASACAGTPGCGGVQAIPVAHVTEVPVEMQAPQPQGHPITSVVVTQCNLIVAVY